ncbi:hypothetical protein WH87_04840 [Devosia epidermidihirudinis]|uniref:DUF5681 domain-containing protein n=1 Tax=Devosia epidermidihirudinis TaxID=1293439 RepID=A0A0F5QFM4_9HYPH|nr:hypothetical protein [Devosia epidermidihirudinis]KKC39523.1 hypothetical protein WH87_04840 [Devosia epidermidihirudinis]
MAPRGGARPGAGRKPGKVSAAKRELSDMAKDHAQAALDTLAAVHADKDAPAAARVSAATAILDRAYGKPPQSLEHSGKDGAPLMPPSITFVLDEDPA